MPTTDGTATKPVTRNRATAAHHAARTLASELRILLATAGERESRGAVKLTSALARREHGNVLVLGVARPYPHDPSVILSGRQPGALNEEARRDVLQSVRRSLRGVEGAAAWTTRAFIGLPVDEIQTIARQWEASLIVLGLGRHNRMIASSAVKRRSA